VHVLIIEDEPIIAMNIHCFLEEIGADSADIAETEDEALAMACEHRPDLITADFSLREGNGPHAVSRIRSDVGEVPVIYITGQPERCASDDADDVAISKPIMWLQVAQAVRQYNLPPA
jgi:CheY-like chemotaxis protein